MNFPPIIFNDPKFSSLITKSHPNQQTSTLIAAQNYLKKLSKFEINEKNIFQSNVINWLKSANKNQLIKYFSIYSPWFVDILQEMTIISKYRPNAKFIFLPDPKTKSIDLPFFYLFDNKNLDKYQPKYTDYFTSYDDNEEGVIDLGKKTEKENIHVKFLENIRYLTLSKNKKEGKKYFFEYNDVVTLSYDCFLNVENLIDIMLNITKKEIFKNPIVIDSRLSENGNKYCYNVSKPEWLKSPFTLTELLCSYFEQSVLVSYEYFLMYNQEISGLYFDKLDELIDNIFKLVSFIGNSNEKKVEIFESIHSNEINKNINNNIQEIIKSKRNTYNYFQSLYNPNFKHTKIHPNKDIINDTLLVLQSLFIKSDLQFVINLTFIKSSTIFFTEDFVIKTVYDMINDFWRKKTVEDLLQDLESSNNNDNNNSNHKKRKKKKKKKNNKTEENKEIKNDDSSHQENKKDEINENENKIIKEISNKVNLIKYEEIKEIKQENTILQTEDINNINSNNDIKYLDEPNLEIKEVKQNNELEKKDEEEKNKTEKDFFLYPVVKNKKKRNKNKKKDKKHNNNNTNHILNINNINDIKETNISASSKSEKTKASTNINNCVSNDNIGEGNHINIITSDNQKAVIPKKIVDNINNLPQKHINKFNKNLNHNSEDIFNNKNNGNNGYFNPNKRESNILRSEEDDKYFLVGSNIPRFTSFYFKSKKKKNRKNSDQGQFSFRANNILEFSKEIIENTEKVNKNKEILKKIREKYIKEIYESINIILKNEDVNFLCSFYGSNISGLSIENSDIDIMVKIRKNQKEINYMTRIMDLITYKLKNNNTELNYIKNIHPIYTASVPVIKLECDLSSDPYLISDMNNIMKKYNLSYNNLTKLFFDITFFEVDNVEEKIPSELMIEYIKDSTKLYPQIIDIIYIMKRFLSNRKLNQSYQGGISSFSLFLLILAFVKYFPKNNIDIPIGSLLIEFLTFYSNFDFYNSVIRPNEKNINDIYIMNTISNDIFKYNINIIDPITGLNVAKSTFKIEEIKTAFKEGLDIIIGNLYKIIPNDINDNYLNVNLDDNKILVHFFFDK